MNIFLSDPDPRLCAIALDDKRVVKMAVETAQLLATALRSVGVEDVSYAATHTKHPCSLWAAESRGNFSWLVEHGLELCAEYEFRYDGRREHASKRAIVECFGLRDNIPVGPCVFGPTRERGGGFNSSGFATGDVFHDYKLCLVSKWRDLDGYKTARSRKPIWTYRGPPAWKRQLWAENFNDYPPYNQVGYAPVQR